MVRTDIVLCGDFVVSVPDLYFQVVLKVMVEYFIPVTVVLVAVQVVVVA